MRDRVRLHHAHHGAGRRAPPAPHAPSSPTSEFARRLAQQMPEDEKIARSDFVFHNTAVAQGAQGVRGADGGADPRRRRHGRGGRRRRARPVRRLVLVGLALAVVARPSPASPCWVSSGCRRRRGARTGTRAPCIRSSTTSAIRAAARRNDLDPALVAAVIYAESRFDAHARSSQGAVGLMQVLPETADADRAARPAACAFVPADLDDPRVNIRYGCYYLRAVARPVRRRRVRGRRRLQRRRRRGAGVGGRGARRGPRLCASPTSRTPRRAPTCAASSRRARSTARPTASGCAGGAREAARARVACERVFVLVESTAMNDFTIQADYSLTGDQPEAVAALSDGVAARRPLPDAARRHRLGQDLHDGQRHREGAEAHAGHRPQQDARGAALQRVPRVPSRTTPSSTSSATTTTTSPRPTSRRRTSTSRRTRPSTTRSTGCATPPPRRSSCAATSSSSPA